MKVWEIVFWVMFALSLFVVGWLVFGNSPTFEQTILVLILTAVIKNSVNIKGMNTKFSYMEKGFKALANGL